MILAPTELSLENVHFAEISFTIRLYFLCGERIPISRGTASGREEKLAGVDRAKRDIAERRRVSLQTFLSLLQTQVAIAT